MPESVISRTRLSELAGALVDTTRDISDGDASVKNIHKLRTTVRRFEVALAEARLGSKRLKKQLATLRRRAGNVRDADVQIEMLDSLRSSGTQSGVDDLSAWLRRRRSKFESKLSEALEKSNESGLKKRLERLQKKAEQNANAGVPCIQAVQSVRERYLELSASIPPSGDALHEFRKSCKWLRYSLEPFGEQDAKELVSRLKQIQDAIGLWHDWEELLAEAEQRLKRRCFPLTALLRVRARSAKIEARRAAAELRDELLAAPSTRKPVVSASVIPIQSVAR